MNNNTLNNSQLNILIKILKSNFFYVDLNEKIDIPKVITIDKEKLKFFKKKSVACTNSELFFLLTLLKPYLKNKKINNESLKIDLFKLLNTFSFNNKNVYLHAYNLDTFVTRLSFIVDLSIRKITNLSFVIENNSSSLKKDEEDKLLNFINEYLSTDELSDSNYKIKNNEEGYKSLVKSIKDDLSLETYDSLTISNKLGSVLINLPKNYQYFLSYYIFEKLKTNPELPSYFMSYINEYVNIINKID